MNESLNENVFDKIINCNIGQFNTVEQLLTECEQNEYTDVGRKSLDSYINNNYENGIEKGDIYSHLDTNKNLPLFDQNDLEINQKSNNFNFNTNNSLLNKLLQIIMQLTQLLNEFKKFGNDFKNQINEDKNANHMDYGTDNKHQLNQTNNLFEQGELIRLAKQEIFCASGLLKQASKRLIYVNNLKIKHVPNVIDSNNSLLLLMNNLHYDYQCHVTKKCEQLLEEQYLFNPLDECTANICGSCSLSNDVSDNGFIDQTICCECHPNRIKILPVLVENNLNDSKLIKNNILIIIEDVDPIEFITNNEYYAKNSRNLSEYDVSSDNDISDHISTNMQLNNENQINLKHLSLRSQSELSISGELTTPHTDTSLLSISQSSTNIVIQQIYQTGSDNQTEYSTIVTHTFQPVTSTTNLSTTATTIEENILTENDDLSTISDLDYNDDHKLIKNLNLMNDKSAKSCEANNIRFSFSDRVHDSLLIDGENVDLKSVKLCEETLSVLESEKIIPPDKNNFSKCCITNYIDGSIGDIGEINSWNCSKSQNKINQKSIMIQTERFQVRSVINHSNESLVETDYCRFQCNNHNINRQMIDLHNSTSSTNTLDTKSIPSLQQINQDKNDTNQNVEKQADESSPPLMINQPLYRLETPVNMECIDTINDNDDNNKEDENFDNQDNEKNDDNSRNATENQNLALISHSDYRYEENNATILQLIINQPELVNTHLLSINSVNLNFDHEFIRNQNRRTNIIPTRFMHENNLFNTNLLDLNFTINLPQRNQSILNIGWGDNIYSTQSNLLTNISNRHFSLWNNIPEQLQHSNFWLNRLIRENVYDTRYITYLIEQNNRINQLNLINYSNYPDSIDNTHHYRTNFYTFNHLDSPNSGDRIDQNLFIPNMFIPYLIRLGYIRRRAISNNTDSFQANLILLSSNTNLSSTIRSSLLLD